MASTAMGGATMPVSAAGSLTITPATVRGTVCHNLSPDTQGAPSAFTAVAGNDRPWTQFSSVTVGTGPNIDGIPEAMITVNLCGAIPSFPVLSNGDTDAEYYLCFSPSRNEIVVGGRYGAVIAWDPITGNPIFDGPYPASQGYKACAWASIGVSGADWGVAWYDPATRQYTGSHDRADMWDGSPANPTISPSTIATGVSSFVMYLPYIWRWTDATGTKSEQVLTTGDTATGFTAASYVSHGADLPTTVCVPDGTCRQGIFDTLTPVDFAPGYEECSAPGQGCAQYGPLGYDLGANSSSAPETCLNPINPNGNNPTNPDLTCDVVTPATGGPSGTQGLPYVATFSYGRILPGPIVPFEGYSYQPFGSFVDDGLTFAA